MLHRRVAGDQGHHPALAGTGAGDATLPDGRDRALATTDQLGTDEAREDATLPLPILIHTVPPLCWGRLGLTS